MAATRTPGITIGADGRFFIDKRYRGVRIGMRVGPVTQEQAEQRLQTEMTQVDLDLARRAQRRPSFAECAQRYLAQSQDMRSLEAMRIHVQLLVEHLGHLEPHQVHDATLAPLISDRIADGVTATTINRTLEVARTILHRAARSYRDEHGRPWLDALPPLITMLPECRRPPYPITWAGQDRLFPKLPGHLARMALFALNTGLRDANLCGLQWSWEVPVPEIGRSVFVVPAEEFKAKRSHVVILNDIAWSIIQTQRGRHAVWVFPYRGRRIARMNNSAWRQARREAGLRQLRVHDLRHTYACRLRAAGVSAEDRAALLGHARNRWWATTRAPTSAACCARPIGCWVGRRRARRCAWRMVKKQKDRRGRPGPTAVPRLQRALGFARQVLDYWRGWQDSNPRPLGS